MAAHQNVENEKRVVYDAVKGELEDKIRHLEEDRQNIDINSGMSICPCIYYMSLCWLHVYGACIYVYVNYISVRFICVCVRYKCMWVTYMSVLVVFYVS